MTIVEKLGGKPGRQTIKECLNPGIPIVDFYEMQEKIDRSSAKTAYLFVENVGMTEAMEASCIEVDDDVFDILSNPFITSFGGEDGWNDLGYVSTSLQTAPLDPANYYDTKDIVADSVPIAFLGMGDQTFLFRKGTLHIVKGTKSDK